MNSNFIYHILIDRFFPQPHSFHERQFNSGTLQGIVEKLDAIKDLGMTGILITPFQTNAPEAYHGYHITDYTEVDPHFGTWDDVALLVQETHRRHMTITADFVANHCHKDNALFRDGQHRHWFRRNDDGSVKGFADLDFLPMFDTDQPEVRKYLTDAALHLCALGFDALRLDHATGPSYAFWKFFRKRIKASYPHVKLIGEVWGEMDFKPRFRLRYWFNSKRYDLQEARQLEYASILDGVLDFYYQSLMAKAAQQGGPILHNAELERQVKQHFKHYSKRFDLWLFLDNHDMNRFLFECQQNRRLLLQALTFSKQWGRPFLQYYGTEKFMTNTQSVFDGSSYADERVRKLMEW